MESLTPPETRARSRSKTPFLRSSCDREYCTTGVGEGFMHIHGRKSPIRRNPTVQTIIEEVSGKSPENRQSKFASKSSKFITSDYSSADTSPELAKNSTQKDTVTRTTMTKTQTVTNSGHFQHFLSNSLDSSEKHSLSGAKKRSGLLGFLNRSKEISQNEINSAFEESQIQKTSTPITFHSKKESKVSTNGDLNSHIGYKEYVEAGEYWNKYPKTDFTYSKLSPHRREIAPGVVAMPNMSRKSLDKHAERVNFMVQQHPTQASYIRERYEQTSYTTRSPQSKQVQKDMYYDSQDEVDLTEFESFRTNRYTTDNYYITNRLKTVNQESWITRFLTTIVTTFYSWTSILLGTSDQHLYYTRIDEQQGFFGRIRSALSTVILSILRPLYLLISVVLYFDTWLLRSSSPDSRNKKRFLLLLLILFPLLLLAAWTLLEDQERRNLIIKAQNLIPVSLIGFRNVFSTNWRELLKLNHFVFQKSETISLPSSQYQYNYESITNNIQKSLSTEEYENLINHINGYVQQLVDDKLAKERKLSIEREQKISPEMSALIANIVRKNIMNEHSETISSTATTTIQRYELNDADIDRIAELVRLQLISSGYNLKQFSLNQANLEEISKLIKHNIEINNKNFDVNEQIDIDEILFKVLQSSQLAKFVNTKILDSMGNGDGRIDNQKILIDELIKEINFIKTKLTENLNENQELHYSIDVLKKNHDEYLDKLNIYEENTNTKFNNLLVEIDSKITAMNKQQFNMINKQVKLAIVEILGYKNGKNIDEIDLQNWIRNMFVAKEFLEAKLSEINLRTNETMKNEIDRSGMILMKEISEKVKNEVFKVIEMREQQNNLPTVNVKSGLTEVDIKKIVGDALATYDADKTGLVDYALESAGGQVISTRCTETYQTKSAQLSIFGIPLWYPSNTPRIAISPAVQPGECWAFKSFPGYLVLKLNTMIFVTGFTLEHIPKSLSPNGKIDSAPKLFSVWGLSNENDQEPTHFGNYEYNTNAALQYFAVQNKEIKRPFDIVELRIESNHGNRVYSCLYRFRVHGTPSA